MPSILETDASQSTFLGYKLHALPDAHPARLLVSFLRKSRAASSKTQQLGSPRARMPAQNKANIFYSANYYARCNICIISTDLLEIITRTIQICRNYCKSQNTKVLLLQNLWPRLGSLWVKNIPAWSLYNETSLERPLPWGTTCLKRPHFLGRLRPYISL